MTDSSEVVERSHSRRSNSRIEIPLINQQPSLLRSVWELIAPLLWRLVVFYTKVFLVMASLAILVVTTVLLYSLVYWMAVPKRLHTYPVFFNYEESGAFACANISLSGRQWEGINRPITDWERPTPGFDFDVSIALEYPSNEHNMRQGPVMFETRAELKNHHEIVKTERPFLIPQLSWFGRLFRDFLTMALTGLLLYQDKSSADIMLIESFPVISQETSLSFIHICMRPPVHVYSATLSFVSKLSGFRYLLAHHPLTVGVVVVGSVLALAIGFLIAAYILRFSKRNIEDDDDEQGPISPISPREEDMMDRPAAGPEAGEEDVTTLRNRRSIRD